MPSKISVVIPCKNSISFIDRAISSVLQQGYKDFELIVIDGASSDGTVERIKSFADAISYWVSEPDLGQTDALIKGFARASGNIFCWLCADDYFEAGAFNCIAAAVEKYPEAVAWIGAAQRRSLSNRPTGIHAPALAGFPEKAVWWKDVCIPQSSCFFSADAFHRVGGINPRVDLAMDIDLWLRLVKLGKFVAIPQVLSSMCVHPGTRSGRNPARTMVDVIAVYCINGYQDAAADLFKHYCWWEYWKQTLYRSPLLSLVRRWLER